MAQQGGETARRVEIDWIRTVAGALAAVVSAVVLSTLGAAGTLIGAAIGSVVATVGGAMFTQGISTSRRKLADAQSLALRKVGVAQAEVRRAARADGATAQQSHLDHADEQLARAKQKLDSAALAVAPVGWRERLSRLPWSRIWVTSGIVFVVVLAAITAFELVAGRSVSSLTGGGDGGTTIGQVTRGGGGGGGGDDDRTPESPGIDPGGTKPTGSPTGTSTPDPAESPVESPADSPAGTPTGGTEQSPTEDPTPSPTEGPADTGVPIPELSPDAQQE